MNKIEAMLNSSKLSELLHKKEKEAAIKAAKKKKCMCILGFIGAVLLASVIVYVVYRYITAKRLDDFEDFDEFDDEFDDFDEELKETVDEE